MGGGWGRTDLLGLVDAGERRHLAVLVRPEHLAHGAGGHGVRHAVDVDPLLGVDLARRDLLPLLRLRLAAAAWVKRNVTFAGFYQ